MKIREGKSSDIPEIVEVLQKSLGPELPVSDEIWEYKHLNNPFGRSIVLVAEEDQKIIGVRAFMKWKWIYNGNEMKSFRAVDTATLPEHRGKGIFKKLTQAAVKIAKEDEGIFIFNTPNAKSRPGYLKMGWEIAGKIEVAILPAYYSFWKLKRQDIFYQYVSHATPGEVDILCKSWNNDKNDGKMLFTPKSRTFLQWRYEKNLLQQYEIFVTPDFYLAGYIKERKNLKELRIVECIFNEKKKKSIEKTIIRWSKRFGAQVISFSPAVLKLNYFFLSGNYGPVLTVRKLNVSILRHNDHTNIENWAYSLGDLELF